MAKSPHSLDWEHTGAQAVLERHADAGHFAREAAAELGVSKSAVISRANRTGITFRPDPARMSACARKAGLASAAKRRRTAR